MNLLTGSPLEKMPDGFRMAMRAVESVLMEPIPRVGVGVVSYEEGVESGCIFRVVLRNPEDELEDLPSHTIEVLHNEEMEKLSGGVVFGKDAYFGMFDNIVRATDILANARGVPSKLMFEEPGEFGRPRAGLQIHYPRFKLVFLNGSV